MVKTGARNCDVPHNAHARQRRSKRPSHELWLSSIAGILFPQNCGGNIWDVAAKCSPDLSDRSRSRKLWRAHYNCYYPRHLLLLLSISFFTAPRTFRLYFRVPHSSSSQLFSSSSCTFILGLWVSLKQLFSKVLTVVISFEGPCKPNIMKTSDLFKCVHTMCTVDCCN